MNKLPSRIRKICPALGIFFCLLFGGPGPAGAAQMLGFDLSNQMEYSWDTEAQEDQG